MTAALSFAAATAVPAAAATTTFRIRSTGTLVAGGAAVRIGIVYKCPTTTEFASVTANVNEVVRRGRVAQGFAAVDDALKCDGRTHSLRIFVPVENGIAFRKGVAFAMGSLSACRGESCTNASAARTITIR